MHTYEKGKYSTDKPRVGRVAPMRTTPRQFQEVTKDGGLKNHLLLEVADRGSFFMIITAFKDDSEERAQSRS